MHTIRSANTVDAQNLSVLAEATFRDTFGSMNTAEDMNLHCQSRYGEGIQSAEIADPSVVTLVCEHDGDLIAYAQLRWSDTPSCVESKCAAEIQRLYVAKPWHGVGVAQAMMNACLRELEAREFDVVWLGVWEHNPRAIAFYQKFGFAEVGSHIFPLGTDPQRDIILVRPVVTTATGR
jgi:ribosomal protein S18 acetylase RimI-like enzyme